MENVEAQEAQNLNLIIKTTNSEVYEALYRYFYCCGTRRKQEERIEQKTAQSKNDVREFFNLQEEGSKFYLPSEMIEKICSFVRFYEEASHDFFCGFNPFKKFNYLETNIKEIYSIDQNVIVSKWHEGCHSKEEDSIYNKSINKLALSAPQIQQQPEEGLLTLMWHPDWHHNQDEMQDKIMGDYDQSFL